MKRTSEILLEADHMLANAEVRIICIKDELKKDLIKNKNELLELQLNLNKIYLSITRIENSLLKIINESLLENKSHNEIEKSNII